MAAAPSRKTADEVLALLQKIEGPFTEWLAYLNNFCAELPTLANSAQSKDLEVSLNAQVGTTYTLTSADRGKVITLTNASGITVTVPAGLGAGFYCTLIQMGAGQVTISASGTTVNNRQSHTKIAGQYGVASLIAPTANAFVLGGDTAA